jgi:probable rRNA maturation factor
VPVLVSRAGALGHAVSLATVGRRARRMLASLSLEQAELSVLLCDDATIRVLNRTHRGLDRPTDVLAFAQREGEAAPATALLGDVVISVPTAARNGRAADRRLLEELTLLLAHGLLHLIGYDHQNTSQERRMQARTKVLVAAALASAPRPVDSPGARPPSGSRTGARRRFGHAVKTK